MCLAHRSLISLSVLIGVTKAYTLSLPITKCDKMRRLFCPVAVKIQSCCCYSKLFHNLESERSHLNILLKKRKIQTFCKKTLPLSNFFFFFSIQKITHIAMAKSVTHRRTKAIFFNLPPSEYSRSMSGTHRNPNKQQPICKLHKSRINTSLSFFMIAVN